MSASSGFVRVLRSSDLAACEGLDTQLRSVRVGDGVVLLGRLKDGKVVAFGATCPHEMTDLRQATFVDGKVRCPRHNYMYDPHSGQNVIPTQIASPESLWKLHPGYLSTHAVEEHDGWVWVNSTANAAPVDWDPALEQRPSRDAHEAPFTQPSAEQAVPRSTVELPAKRLRVRLGHVFELRLPMDGTPACTWKVDVPAGPLAVVEQRFDPASPPRQRVRIAARAPGLGTVRCSYGRPWDGEPEETRTYIVEVVPM